MESATKINYNNYYDKIKLGQDVYFFIEYEGISKGIVKSIDTSCKPLLYVVESTDGDEFKVPAEHIFQTISKAKDYEGRCVEEAMNDLRDKLNLDYEQIMLKVRVYAKQPPYNYHNLKRFIGHKVMVTFKDGTANEGILCYMKKHTDRNNITQENFFYLSEPVGSFHNLRMLLSFKGCEITKIVKKGE